MEEAAQKTHKKIWVPIVVIVAVMALILLLLIVGMKKLSDSAVEPAPVLVAQESEYKMYETRPGEVLLTYNITLRNNTGKDLEDFTLRGVLKKDYDTGFLLSPDATVRRFGEQTSTFSLKNGETQTMELIFTASYYPRDGRTCSKEIPQLYATYADGTEGRIEIQE